MTPPFGHVDEATLAEIAVDERRLARLTAPRRQHLDECDRCSRLVDGHARAMRLLSAGWRMVPAAELQAAGLAPLQPRIRAGGAFGSAEPARRPAWIPLAVAVAALVLVLLALLAAGSRPVPVSTSTRLALAVAGDVIAVDVDGTDVESVTQATGGSRLDSSPAWAPDGGLLAFARTVDATGTRRVVLVGAGESDAVQLLDAEPGPGSLAWSPDGGRLAVWEIDGVVLLDPVTGQRESVLRRSQAPGGTGLLSWSPDGTRILAGTDEGDLVLVNVASAAVSTVLDADPAGGVAFRASREAWSPDGSRFAFFADLVTPGEVNDDDASVMVADADGSGRLELASGRFPTWSPDGTLIAFESDVEPHGIWVVRPDGSGLRFVGDGRRPSWSPDGRFLAYCGHDDETGGIFIADAAGGPARLLLEQSCWYDWGEYPSWQATSE